MKTCRQRVEGSSCLANSSAALSSTSQLFGEVKTPEEKPEGEGGSSGTSLGGECGVVRSRVVELFLFLKCLARNLIGGDDTYRLCSRRQDHSAVREDSRLSQCSSFDKKTAASTLLETTVSLIFEVSLRSLSSSSSSLCA